MTPVYSLVRLWTRLTGSGKPPPRATPLLFGVTPLVHYQRLAVALPTNGSSAGRWPPRDTPNRTVNDCETIHDRNDVHTTTTLPGVRQRLPDESSRCRGAVSRLPTNMEPRRGDAMTRLADDPADRNERRACPLCGETFGNLPNHMRHSHE